MSTNVERILNYCRYIGSPNKWAGQVAAFLFLPLIFLVSFEVFLRYALNSPTIFAWDVNVRLLATLTILRFRLYSASKRPYSG